MNFNSKEFIDIEYIIVLNVIEYLCAMLDPIDYRYNPDSIFNTYGINGPEQYKASEINQILYN